MKKIVLSNLFALALGLAVVALTGLPAAADDVVSITGTVTSMNDEVFVLSTDQGNVTFEYDKNTVMPAGIVVGKRITVWHDADDKLTNKIDARRIELSPEASAVTPTTAPPVPEPAPQPTAAEHEQLPATASPLPLIAIVGLLSLAGGMLLRNRTQ
jgi:hypothetical protein